MGWNSLSATKVGEICNDFRKISEAHLKNGLHAEVISALLLAVACSISADCRVSKVSVDELKSDVLFTLSEYIDQVHKSYVGKNDVE